MADFVSSVVVVLASSLLSWVRVVLSGRDSATSRSAVLFCPEVDADLSSANRRLPSSSR